MLETKELHAARVQMHGAVIDLFRVPEIAQASDLEHMNNTPNRFAKAMFEMMEGCWEDPHEVLRTCFSNKGTATTQPYDEIVYVNAISFVSLCEHHLLPFFGKVYFGYLPDAYIVGLSKIPRLVEVYSRRPQLQEKLTCQIVDTFNEIIKPKGCGIVIESFHLCMNIRGVENESAYSRTTALRGCFREGSTKEEFLDGIKKVTPHIWP